MTILKDDTSLKKWKCELCKNEFKVKNNLDKHIKNLHEGKREICEICGKDFSNIDNMKTHMKSHDPAKQKLHKFYYMSKRI